MLSGQYLRVSTSPLKQTNETVSDDDCWGFNAPFSNFRTNTGQPQVVFFLHWLVTESMGMEMTKPEQTQWGIKPGLPDYKSNALLSEVA